MVEWHVPPDYIVNNWTDELLNLLTEKLVERKGKERTGTSKHKDSEETLFARARNLIKVVKK